MLRLSRESAHSTDRSLTGCVSQDGGICGLLGEQRAAGGIEDGDCHHDVATCYMPPWAGIRDIEVGIKAARKRSDQPAILFEPREQRRDCWRGIHQRSYGSDVAVAAWQGRCTCRSRDRTQRRRGQFCRGEQ